MLDFSKVSFDELAIFQHITNEANSYQLNYCGPKDYLLTYLHTSLYEKYSLVLSDGRVLVRSKEDPQCIVLNGEQELTFKDAVKSLLSNLLDKTYAERLAAKEQGKIEEAQREQIQKEYENSLEYERLQKTKAINDNVLEKLDNKQAHDKERHHQNRMQWLQSGV